MKSQIPLVMNLMLKIMFIYRVCVYQEPKSIKNSIYDGDIYNNLLSLIWIPVCVTRAIYV